MNCYFGMEKYTFPIEEEGVDELCSWMAKYSMKYNISTEYYLPGMTFRMIDVFLPRGAELVFIKSCNDAVKIIRENNRKRGKKGI